MRRLSILVAMILVATASPALSYEASGTVTHIADGDTFDVKVGGSTDRIRMLGINTNEIGTCHASAATARLAQLIDGKNVTLSAKDPSVTLRGRLGRWVDVGSTDVGKVLLEEGLALLFPHPTETTRLSRYRTAADVGRATGQGLWDDDACGSGPNQSADLSLNVRWDARLDDESNVNGEWVDVVNRSSSAVSMSGWQLRDTALTFYSFPSSVSVPANGSVRVHVGKGTNKSTVLYWGLSEPLFDNFVGDGVFLLDPDDDIRASFEYPCTSGCTDPRGDVLRMEYNYDAPGNDQTNPNGEWVKVRNIGSSTVDLYGLSVASYPYAYHFDLNDSIPKGGTMTVYIGKGTDTSTKKYWGNSGPILDNGGDSLSLERSDGVVLLSYRWPVPEGLCNLAGDGSSDLAVAIPGDNLVSVLQGSPASGLKPWSDFSTIGTPEALGCGDFNNDGYTDLAIGVPGEALGSKSQAGMLNVLYGSSSGLKSSGDQTWHQDSSGIGGVAEPGDRFAETLTTGDFNNDGYTDLAIGVPGEALGSKSQAGMLNVLYGSSSGLKSSGDQTWHQDSSGIGGVAEPGDRFAETLGGS